MKAEFKVQPWAPVASITAGRCTPLSKRLGDIEGSSRWVRSQGSVSNLGGDRAILPGIALCSLYRNVAGKEWGKGGDKERGLKKGALQKPPLEDDSMV